MPVIKLSVLIFSFFALTISLAKETSHTSVDVKNPATPISVDTKNITTPTNTKNIVTDSQKASQINTPTDLNKPISVTSNLPVFTIRMSVNLSTGYQWYLADYNPRFMRLLDQKYVSAQTKITGAPGLSVWEFQLQQISFAAPQVTHITFEYRRPWEPKAVKKQSFTVISQQPTVNG